MINRREWPESKERKELRLFKERMAAGCLSFFEEAPKYVEFRCSYQIWQAQRQTRGLYEKEWP